MRLTKLKLMNYRCFGADEQVIEIDDMTTFIGNNSAGKTAALSALNCMFSENGSDRLLHRSDFHLPHDMVPDAMEKQELHIETVFEFDEVKDENGNSGYAIPIFFQHLVVEEPGGIPYLRIRLEAAWEKSSTVEGSIDSSISYIVCPESDEIEEKHYVTAKRRDLDRIRVIYVPAVRDPSKQLKNVSGAFIMSVLTEVVLCRMDWLSPTSNICFPEAC